MEKTENNGKWYAVHTYSGYEGAVARNLKQRVESLGAQDRIFDVIVPVEKKFKVKNGKKIEVENNVYPGYVLVNMLVDEETWYLVRNTPRVSGFVGSGVRPVPLADDEVKRIFDKMNSTDVSHENSFVVEEVVKITDGPFINMEGKISEVDSSNGKAKVNVLMFGRETPVELDFVQIRKV